MARKNPKNPAEWETSMERVRIHFTCSHCIILTIPAMPSV